MLHFQLLCHLEVCAISVFMASNWLMLLDLLEVRPNHVSLCAVASNWLKRMRKGKKKCCVYAASTSLLRKRCKVTEKSSCWAHEILSHAAGHEGNPCSILCILKSWDVVSKNSQQCSSLERRGIKGTSILFNTIFTVLIVPGWWESGTFISLNCNFCLHLHAWMLIQ